MSATKTHGSPAKFPTPEELGPFQKALAKAYNAVEDLNLRLDRVLDPWLDAGEVLDRPTYETVGVLADMTDSVEVEVAAITGELEKIKASAHQVLAMRGDLEVRDRKAAA